MKKLLIISILLVSLNVQLQAQDQISFGVKAGVNFAYATGDASDSGSQLGYDEGRTAFHAGLVSELELTEKFSIQPELLYSQVGAAYLFDNRSFDGIRVESDLNLDYLSLPILAKYYVFKGLSLELGPQFSYILNSEIENQILSSGFISTETIIVSDFNIKDDINRFEFGLALGTSYELLNTGLFIQARYVIGLTEVFDNQNFTTSTDLKNAVIQFSVGYKF
ncbi:porin family protein [Psychroflexus sp. MES1-P1E]|uniref:porin family protein n=1 Tax=Psychroflexus sp. MES1-P1E TaxID=2058320 RepID=UPI000C7BEEF9|nr:porin family protein [Psychroflexus sp. MES1-P1E]PKG43034.1 PorT family protein [Psychroflexus sp. MES1-P1E]